MTFTQWTQRDAVSCGPAVAVVAGARIDPAYGARLTDEPWFHAEQARVHAAVSRCWPRRLGTTPAGVARAIERVSGVRYRWRPWWGRRDRLADVLAAVDAGWPVALLVGRIVPRHWVLMVARNRLFAPGVVQCYEPSSGQVRPVALAALRTATLNDVGFPRAWAFVLPRQPAGSLPDHGRSNI